jgi:Na+/H+ antiporter NhaD/arsenite permease-like protein
MLPVAVVGLAINHALLLLLFRRQLAAATLATPDAAGEPAAAAVPLPSRRRAVFTAVVLGATVIAYLGGTDLAWTATAGFTALLLVHRADPTRFWARIDWSVLLFFGGLFVVVEGLVASGAAARVLARVSMWPAGVGGPVDYLRTAAYFLLGSNVVSNVPFILVVRDEVARMPHPQLAWELLAMASTFAGNLTLLGSVANIIVAERGRQVGGLGFAEYLRVGLPVALLTTAVGVIWLLGVHGIL